jgi:hypothetical protein
VAEAASPANGAEGPPNSAGVGDFAALLRAILENQAEFGLDDHQTASLSRLYFEHSAKPSSANTVAYVADILTPSQFQAAVAKLAERAAATTTPPTDANTIENMVAAAIQKETKDKTLVEIGIAAAVTERLIAWARIFAYFVAIPAAVVLVVLSIFGYSKFEDARKLADKAETNLRGIDTQMKGVETQLKEVNRTNLA